MKNYIIKLAESETLFDSSKILDSKIYSRPRPRHEEKESSYVVVGAETAPEGVIEPCIVRTIAATSDGTHE